MSESPGLGITFQTLKVQEAYGYATDICHIYLVRSPDKKKGELRYKKIHSVINHWRENEISRKRSTASKL